MFKSLLAELNMGIICGFSPIIFISFITNELFLPFHISSKFLTSDILCIKGIESLSRKILVNL